MSDILKRRKHNYNLNHINDSTIKLITIQGEHFVFQDMNLWFLNNKDMYVVYNDNKWYKYVWYYDILCTGVITAQIIDILNKERTLIIKDETELYNYVCGVYMIKHLIHPDVHFYISTTFVKN